MLNKLRRLGQKPEIIIKYLSLKGWLKWVPDKQYLELLFYAYMGKKLNLRNPVTYNEKLQWLKLHDRRVEMTTYVDKYTVRMYVESTIGEQYLVSLLGIYSHVNEIELERLPGKFVLKCNHDSGGVIICKDKSKLDLCSVKEKINTYLGRNYYNSLREWPYKNIKPRIICEQYLQDNLTDYKFMCFHGEPKLIQIHRNRNSEDYTLDFYDVNWNKTEIRRETPTTEGLIPRPEHFEEMLEIAKKLSENEIHVRIDLYEVDQRVYFSEKTYYSASGLAPFLKDEDDELIGSWIELPKV